MEMFQFKGCVFSVRTDSGSGIGFSFCAGYAESALVADAVGSYWKVLVERATGERMKLDIRKVGMRACYKDSKMGIIASGIIEAGRRRKEMLIQWQAPYCSPVIVPVNGSSSLGLVARDIERVMSGFVSPQDLSPNAPLHLSDDVLEREAELFCLRA
ncbi:MAG: hypothetical protein OXR68_05325 [Alphaproteobacteria bacterium]|nr:hypothetical protein [Alphaproteobacteria bacterium]MDD9920024.1 hypothetical protein [Alphaproteobacteria bacterium]